MSDERFTVNIDLPTQTIRIHRRDCDYATERDGGEHKTTDRRVLGRDGGWLDNMQVKFCRRCQPED